MESDGDRGFEGEEISLLAKELIHLTVKSSLVESNGHSLQDCKAIQPAEKDKVRKDPPFSLALKTESNLIGRESVKLNALSKKLQSQWSYVGTVEESMEVQSQRKGIMATIPELQAESRMVAVEEGQ
ncbi:hypothetical protein J1N35_014504 [Gossypium stocksii]|uniref:Uncharacterized protein n=1 Tax=Gossypium stocksii TaxID=47602 RepID=A0A9D3VVG6_9ROSI|nr:hypothetical protein J1N35_014504 [Gossypium stocksii]